MVLLSVSLAFVQEHRSNNAAARLRAMVRTTATVLRRGAETGIESHGLEIPIEELVPGDVVRLAAGDMIPADLRVLTAKDLFLIEAVLTGEAMPVENRQHRLRAATARCRPTRRISASWAATS
ncbi:MAG: hypothetical protein WA709_35245 [Stellaceae bacterium]